MDPSDLRLSTQVHRKHRVFLATAAALVAFAPPLAGQSLPTEKLQALYLSRLDAWVASRDLKVVQEEVVGNCGKLMYLRDPSLGSATSAELKETLDMRIDVCAKITVHRVHPQPEFSKPAINKIVCGDMPKNEPVLGVLCAKAGVKN